MDGTGERPAGAASGRYAAASPPEFTTAFRSGTGGHRVVVHADRITTHYRAGGGGVLPLDDIVAVSTFVSGFSEPAYGVHLELRSPRRAAGYLFEDAETRCAFLRAVRRRMRPHAASGRRPWQRRIESERGRIAS